jgi:two-component system chemotaxis response regulator CheY
MSYRILIVDDSAIVRKVMAKTIAMSGVKTDEPLQAGDGQQALDVLKKEWVDLVFLDINMPIMNGIEFMERVSKDETLKSIPVVVVSTEGSTERKDRLKELGIKVYLRKPVTPEAVATVVKAMLGGAQ